MRLGRSASVSKRRDNHRLVNSRTRKKHKKLDAICEKTFNRNHSSIEAEPSECNVGGGDESELRRSTRVRRAPEVLDASPPPVKKRRRVDKIGNDSIERVKRRDGMQIGSPCSTSRDAEEESDGWRSRLRSRAKNASFGVRVKGNSSTRGRRKLFEDLDGFKEEPKLEIEECDDKEEGLESGKSTVVKSKRPGRVKASNKEVVSSGGKEDGKEKNEVVLENKDNEVVLENNDNEVFLENIDNENHLQSNGGVGYGSQEGAKDGKDSQMVGKEEGVEGGTCLELEDSVRNANVNTLEQDMQMNLPESVEERGNPMDTLEQDMQMNIPESAEERENQMDTLEQAMQVNLPESVEERENQMDAIEFGKVPTDQAEEVGGYHDKPVEDENAINVDKSNCASTATLGKPRIKEGRRCGLCGGGTDGKPPKKLVHDGAGSDNEAYSGSSTSDETNYDIWDGFGDEPSWLGRLLGPINDRFGIARIWVHQHCAVWSPEVYFAGLGCLKNVRAALCRGRVLKCTRCMRPGATIGCRVDRCPKTYHLPCARANGCVFDHRKFLIACTDHRHLFQPHGSKFISRIKKMKAKKMKFELRKLSNDAWRKDHEAEEKWLENCGEDEEFLRRENKRLHRDLLRIAPVYIGGSNPESEINYQGWESVAGLQHVIQCMKEVVILPLLYPEFFGNLGLTPPRGVLLHGYPGTGKTLVVRALIGSCARGDKRIAYFARKGADCLGKYVGDAERQLRLLFQVAEKSQPSIIFFDEIDGLAPSRTRQQDQTHSSVVSTLLALLDGLKSRGSVVVIGATNRPDAVDPALRRPGRFDREIYFPLPSIHDRAAILSLHTKKWPKPVSGSLLNWVARRTVGFAGADLQALCTQAAIIALRRNCPFQELLSAAGEKAPHGMRPPLPTFTVEERDWLEAISCAPPPCSRREAGMAANDVISSPLHMHLSPCLVRPLSILVISLFLDERLWLPPSLSKAATQIKSVIVSALDRKKVQSDQWWTHVHNLLQEADVVSDIENSLSRARILIGEATYPSYGGSDADTDDNSTKYDKSKLRQISTRTSLLQSLSNESSEKKSRFRILISGSSRSGQKYLGSCLLHCFVGNVEIRKIDLATISQEGLGDLVQGVTRILMGCASESSCLIFMPRIDLWAIETCHQIGKQESYSSDLELSEENESCLTHGGIVEKQNESCPSECESANKAEPHDAAQRSAYIWSSFVEQVESMCVSTSLMILATSEVPFPLLPLRVRQFFQSDLLNCSLSTPLVDTVPRFSVEVDGNFSRDMVISSSAAELSKDLAQQFIQFIHHKIHIHTSSCNKEEASDTDPGSAIEHEKSTQRPFSSVMNVQVPTLKGKSSLFLAISTMGYQILRYPHFAELCWVTSKLKNGPCSDINGPWKGWPFNTCIVRPNNSLEKVAIACNSSTINGKENPGLVRGLIAVGLLAYRGVYKSLREVSSEVRKVLELLAGEINAKVQAGKDRYQFVRILSQVAYLEDMVNCWAYTLQSLEVDAQTTVTDPKPTSCGSPNNYNTCKDNLLQTDGCKVDVSSKTSHKSEMLEESPQRCVSNNTECVDLDKGDGDSRSPNSEERVAEIEGPPHQIPLDHSALDIHSQSSARVANPFGGKLLKEKNGNDPELYNSKHRGNYAGADGGVGSFKHSNGFAGTDSVIFMEDGTCDSGESNRVKLPSYRKDGSSRGETGIPSKDGNPNSDEHNVDMNFSSTTTGLSSDSGVACFYRCCSECISNLHRLMQKILNSEWGLKASDWTVEDVHDLVSSLSVNLHSAVRKFFFSDDIGKMSETQEMGICCKTSGNSLIAPMNPMECTCHSRSENVTSTIANLSLDSHCGLDLKFIYRDGVLASLDSEKDVSFHCKFETLCLCSLIEWIVVIKQP